jgi:hypothetical protein
MKRSVRRGRIWKSLLVVAVVSGVVASAAYSASLVTYCNDCTLSSSGVPAVSGGNYYFFENYITVSPSPADIHVYLYNTSTGNQTCNASATSQIYIGSFCSNIATARCHLLNGTGPRSATCWAWKTP